MGRVLWTNQIAVLLNISWSGWSLLATRISSSLLVLLQQQQFGSWQHLSLVIKVLQLAILVLFNARGFFAIVLFTVWPWRSVSFWAAKKVCTSTVSAIVRCVSPGSAHRREMHKLSLDFNSREWVAIATAYVIQHSLLRLIWWHLTSLVPRPHPLLTRKWVWLLWSIFLAFSEVNDYVIKKFLAFTSTTCTQHIAELESQNRTANRLASDAFW